MPKSFSHVNLSDHTRHPGKPDSKPLFELPKLDFDYHNRSSYCADEGSEKREDLRVIDLVPDLHKENPLYDDLLAWKSGVNVDGRTWQKQRSERMYAFGYKCKDRTVSRIARALLESSSLVCSMFIITSD